MVDDLFLFLSKSIERGSLPCMNSKSLFTTVFRNRQWARKKRGYCPTTYMMLDAMIALLSLPRFCSHRPRRSAANKKTNQQPGIGALGQTSLFRFGPFSQQGRHCTGPWSCATIDKTNDPPCLMHGQALRECRETLQAEES